MVKQRDDLLARAAPVEVLHIHRHRLRLAGVQAGVPAHVADDEVDAAVPGEVTRDDAIPPPLAVLQARRVPSDELPAAGVVEHRDGHPFAHDDQIGAAVAVHVPPDRVGHHADMLELGREPLGHVGEVPVAVVLEQRALGIGAVVPRHHAPAHEEIDVPVAVVVGRRHARAAHVFGGEAADGLTEVAASVVQVQPVLQRRRPRRELAAAAHDVEVGIPVTVGVEEHGPQVFRCGVRLEQLLVRAHKPSVGPLDQ